MLTDDQMNEELAFTIEFAPYELKLTAFASGRLEGLEKLLDVAYATPREHVQAVVINYIPDLLHQHRPKQDPGFTSLGFWVDQCENGAWVVRDYDVWNDKTARYACADDEALYVQMRAWTERQIAAHRKRAAKRTETEAGPHLSALRGLSV